MFALLYFKTVFINRKINCKKMFKNNLFTTKNQKTKIIVILIFALYSYKVNDNFLFDTAILFIADETHFFIEMFFLKKISFIFFSSGKGSQPHAPLESSPAMRKTPAPPSPSFVIHVAFSSISMTSLKEAQYLSFVMYVPSEGTCSTNQSPWLIR